MFKTLLLAVVSMRWGLKAVLGLGIIAPIALFLATVGAPVLGILGVLAIPVMLLLFVFGLPIFLVLLVGGGVIGLLFAALSVGLVFLKLFVVFVLPCLLVYWVARWIFGWGRKDEVLVSVPVDDAV
ncbi:MAG: hypothetical protein JWO05_3355 [Gemmatimonadetes bacterium]|nr:hypothetical protein [Gemmatimonadota bacterium]